MSDLRQDEDYYGSLKLLANMGFNDVSLNREALRATNGSYAQAIEYLTNPSERAQIAAQNERRNSIQQEQFYNPPPSFVVQQPLTKYIFPQLNPQQAQVVLQIATLGFDDEGKIRHALTLTQWNVEQAIEKLLEQNESLKSDFSSFLDSVGIHNNDLLFLSEDPYAINQSHSRSGSANRPMNYTGNGGRKTSHSNNQVTNPSDRRGSNSYASLNQNIRNSNSTQNNPFGNAGSIQNNPLSTKQKVQNPFEEKIEDPFADFNKG
jgi:hypothetical protein